MARIVPDLIINHEIEHFNKVRFSIRNFRKLQKTIGNKGKFVIKLQ